MEHTEDAFSFELMERKEIVIDFPREGGFCGILDIIEFDDNDAFSVFEDVADNSLGEQIAFDIKSAFDLTKIKNAKGPILSVGFDSEFYYPNLGINTNTDTSNNNVLSYQMYGECEGVSHSLILYPKGSKVEQRLSLKYCLGKFVSACLEAGVIEQLPSVINIYGHFLRADLPSLNGFWNIKKKLSGVGGTVTGALINPYEMDSIRSNKKVSIAPLKLPDASKHLYDVYVNFKDTMLLTPGRGGLAVAGDAIGVAKYPIPAGYSIERMDDFLLHDKAAFERYALRDAEITCLYGLEMEGFVRRELGLKGLPTTIGSCAVKRFEKTLDIMLSRDSTLGDRDYIFGDTVVSEPYWNNDKSRVNTRKKIKVVSRRDNIKDFVTKTYFGGRNEGIYTGATPLDDGSLYSDLDLRGAYTIGLCDLFTPDYNGIKPSTDINDYLGHVAGFAYVKFSFPDTVRFPCIPVSAGDKGLIFPLEGEGYCTAPELMVAQSLGCNIDVILGYIVPWAQEETRLFEPFVTQVRVNRNKAKEREDKHADLLWKELGNSLYGKLAQGLKDKTAFDTKTGGSKKIDESPITNEIFASHTTGFIRGVIAELLNSIADDKVVVSVTTDGFLSNAAYDDFKCDTPLCARYQSLCDAIDGKPMLEVKTKVVQAIGMRTRGQLTTLLAYNYPPVLAKAGIKPEVAFDYKDTKDELKLKHNEWMVERYLSRHFNDAPISFSSLISMREMWLTESDLVSVQHKRRVNLEYDFKRRPVDPKMISVREGEHLAFDSEPWATVDEFYTVRAHFDGFSRKGNLKTVEDFDNWLDYYQARLMTKNSGMKANSKGCVDILRRVFLRAYARNCWGLSRDKSYAEIAAWLTGAGFKTGVDELKNATRAKLVEGIVPISSRVISLLKVILVNYPALELHKVFSPENLVVVRRAIGDTDI